MQKYDAFILRIWLADVEPHLRMMLKQIESEQTWHFTNPTELTERIVQLATALHNSDATDLARQ